MGATMRMDNLHDLFEHELQDIYDAELRLTQALRRQALESTEPTIRDAFSTHEAQTRGQVKRLEQVFEMWGREPSRGEGCAGIQGLIEEHDRFAREDPAPAILDTFNLTAAAKVERYEITAYESMIRLADQLGLDGAIELLAMTLAEEQGTLELVEGLSEEEERATTPRKGRPQKSRAR